MACFSVDTAKQGIDVAKYGYDKNKEATNPVQSKLKKCLGLEIWKKTLRVV